MQPYIKLPKIFQCGKARLESAPFGFILSESLLHQEEIIAGFASMYHLLLAQRDALLALNSPLRAFEGCTLRTIVRLYYHYGIVLETLSSPTSLRVGADRWIEMQFLQGPQPNTATSSEQRALIKLH